QSPPTPSPPQSGPGLRTLVGWFVSWRQEVVEKLLGAGAARADAALRSSTGGSAGDTARAELGDDLADGARHAARLTAGSRGRRESAGCAAVRGVRLAERQRTGAAWAKPWRGPQLAGVGLRTEVVGAVTLDRIATRVGDAWAGVGRGLVLGGPGRVGLVHGWLVGTEPGVA